MRIEFEPIASVGDVEEVAAMVEIRTLFHGATYVGDLEWDEDALLASFLEQLEDASLREDYAQERSAGIQEAKDRLLSELCALIAERHDQLGENSPFRRRFADGLLLEVRPQTELTIAGVGYLWMSLHWLVQSEKNYLVLDKSDRSTFGKSFESVFELICCFAVAGYHQTAVWYFGSGRSAVDFLARLRNVASACGTGLAKAIDQLEENQRGANDGGVDLMAIELHDGVIRNSALAYLVGATVQRSDRRGKIMGPPEITRFRNFFQNPPLLAYQGVLAVPFPRTLIEAQNCRDQGGLYFGREDVIYHLGKAPVGPTRGHLAQPAAKLLRATREFAGDLVMASNDADLPIHEPVAQAAIA